MGKAYREKSIVGTVFSPFVDEYYLDHNKRLQVKPVQRNQEEYIQSQKSCLLEEIFDRFSDVGFFTGVQTEVDQFINEGVRHLTNYDMLLEADSIVDEYRTEFNIGTDVSRADVLDMIRNKAQEHFNKAKENNNEAPNEAPQESE